MVHSLLSPEEEDGFLLGTVVQCRFGMGDAYWNRGYFYFPTSPNYLSNSDDMIQTVAP